MRSLMYLIIIIITPQSSTTGHSHQFDCRVMTRMMIFICVVLWLFFLCLALLVCFLYIHFWLLLLHFILGDVNGSLEAINDALQTYKSRKISLNILSAEVGAVNENDIKLAETFKGRRSYFLTVAFKSWNNFSLFSLLPSAIFRYSVWF